MANSSRNEKILRVARKVGIIRPRDVARYDIPRVYLRRLCQRGLLVQSGRGLYTLPETKLTENHSLAETCKRIPHAVICLLSALRFHGLTTQAPSEIWVALDPKARSPKSSSPSLRVVRMSGKALTEGIEEHRIEGVTVRVYSAAKTVADCFKYRNKIGLDVALEALKDYRRANPTGMDELWRFAKICRVARVMRPYLEAVS
jgi:predicted transcriptional regulator of viral defense system